MFKKTKIPASQPLLDDARILVLSDTDMDKILGGFQEPEHTIMPNNAFAWEPVNMWTDSLLD